MIIGIPKEIKNNENRVALTPAGAKELVKEDTPYMCSILRVRTAVFQIQPMRQSEQRFSRRSTTSTRLLK